MKVLFDTSVLVAAFEVSHSRHSVCLPWLQRAQEKEIDGYLSTHTLAELYSVLTRLPVGLWTNSKMIRDGNSRTWTR